MPTRDILLLGNPTLYETGLPVTPEEIAELRPVIDDMQATVRAYRAEHGVGRAIAAPQIGVLKRIIFLERISNTSDANDTQIVTPSPLINPVLSDLSDDTVELWDDCFSFPDLLVRVRRHRTCTITYRDLDWQEHTVQLEGDLSELLQHECDHLDGILAVARAIDGTSFAYRSQLSS